MKLDLKTLPVELLVKLAPVKRYLVPIFIAFVLSLYGYLVMQTKNATNVQPSAAQDTAVKPAPRIDPNVVSQLKQLQDNSVSVQALFNEARTNPFQ